MNAKPCEAKKSQYNFIVDSFNHKNNSILDFVEVIKFIKKNHLELFDNMGEYVDEAAFETPQSLFIVTHCKWKSREMPKNMAQAIRNKFGCDVTFTMTDDDECDEYILFKGKDHGRVKK